MELKKKQTNNNNNKNRLQKITKRKQNEVLANLSALMYKTEPE